jgi:hypothetical protein
VCVCVCFFLPTPHRPSQRGKRGYGMVVSVSPFNNSHMRIYMFSDRTGPRCVYGMRYGGIVWYHTVWYAQVKIAYARYYYQYWYHQYMPRRNIYHGVYGTIWCAQVKIAHARY